LPGVPTDLLAAPAGACAAYIAEVAKVFSSPRWSVAPVSLPGAASVLFAYLFLGITLWCAHRALERRSRLASTGASAGRTAAMALCAALLLLAVPRLLSPGPVSQVPAEAVARIEVLDIGQGDAILVRSHRQPPILIDGGPPGGAVEKALRDRGIRRLGLALATHSDADHIGGIRELIGALAIDRIALGTPDAQLEASARAAGVPVSNIAQGDVIRSGPLRLEALWPPPGHGRPIADGPEQNAMSVVLLATTSRFRMLLTADAEAETTHVDAGPVDILKVAHHGSRDAGLPSLLAQTSPVLAVISVGDDNRFGHPTPETLEALEDGRVPVRRTDRHGSVAINVTPSGYALDD